MPIDQGQPEFPQTFIGLVFAAFAAVGGFFSGKRAGRKSSSGYPSDAYMELIANRVYERKKEEERHLKEQVSAILDQRLKRLEHPEDVD